jgi:pyridoxal phosphate enzyme (YggS family)
MKSSNGLMSKYGQVKAEIAKKALSSGRKDCPQLIAVSKYAPLDALETLYAEGCRDFGESRLQEALPKIESMPSDIRWHFMGRLQSNKVSKVIEFFSFIHSVDSLELAQIISKTSFEKSKVTSILLQVNTSNEKSKQGFTVEECRSLYSKLSELPGIKVEGLMTMAPLTDDQSLIRASFVQLHQLKEELKLAHLSMGMSQDYPVAIEEGATLLRIGRLLWH